MLATLYVALSQQVENPVLRLQLNGKVVLVPNQPFEAFSARRGNDSWPVAVRRNPGRPDNFVAKSLRGIGHSEVREIRPEEATLAGNRMAGRALALAEEDLSATFCIARKH